LVAASIENNNTARQGRLCQSFGSSLLDGHPLLGDAAINAVRQWKYTNAIEGKPAPVIATVTVDFNLR
jgi:hypothetical protein